MIDLKELKRLAEGATQGVWYRDSFKDRDFPQIVANKTDVIYQVNESSHTRIRKEKVIDNANYIAAANPSTILQLIKEHQEMREALEIVSELWMEHGCINQQCVICKIYEAAKIKEALTKKSEE